MHQWMIHQTLLEIVPSNHKWSWFSHFSVKPYSSVNRKDCSIRVWALQQNPCQPVMVDFSLFPSTFFNHQQQVRMAQYCSQVLLLRISSDLSIFMAGIQVYPLWIISHSVLVGYATVLGIKQKAPEEAGLALFVFAHLVGKAMKTLEIRWVGLISLLILLPWEAIGVLILLQSGDVLMT